MSAKYLLPCRCGQYVAVEPRQAGETVVCECGTPLAIPTMLEITALEKAPEETAPTAATGHTSWGWHQRMVLLGGLLLLAAVVTGVWVVRTQRPVAPADILDPELLRQDVERLPPAVTWKNWCAAKKGLDRRTDQRYEDALTLYHVWATTTIVAGVGGLVLIGLGAAKWRALTAIREAVPREAHTPND